MGANSVKQGCCSTSHREAHETHWEVSEDDGSRNFDKIFGSVQGNELDSEKESIPLWTCTRSASSVGPRSSCPRKPTLAANKSLLLESLRPPSKPGSSALLAPGSPRPPWSRNVISSARSHSTDEEAEGEEEYAGSPARALTFPRTWAADDAQTQVLTKITGQGTSFMETVPEAPGTNFQQAQAAKSTLSPNTSSISPRQAKPRWRAGSLSDLAKAFRGIKPNEDAKHEAFFTQTLLELGLAICNSTAADLQAFADSMRKEERKALRVMAAAAQGQGLLHRRPKSWQACLEPSELAQSFLQSYKESQSKPNAKHPPAFGDKKTAMGKSFGSTRTLSSIMTETSYTDFNSKHQSYRISEEEPSEERPSFLEFLGNTPLKMSWAVGHEDCRDPARKLTVPKIQIVPTEDIEAADASSGSRCHSEAVTYNSAGDHILRGDHEKEVVQAKVDVSDGDTDEHVWAQARISFESRCLRTQNEWQRHLLTQQRSLLTNLSTKLTHAEHILSLGEAVADEQKEMLLGFRKIVRRDFRHDQFSELVTIYALERKEETRTEVSGLCQILDYSCMTFENSSEAQKQVNEAAVRALQQCPNLRWDGKSLPHKWSAAPTWPSSDSTATSGVPTSHEERVKVVLVGKEWLQRGLPREWCAAGFFVVLTSQPEELEDVGHFISVSGDAEIRECLRSRFGIRDYLMHPLSLEGLRSVVKKAILDRFGDEYLLSQVVGRGTSGVVHQAKRLRDGKSFALKEVNTRRLSKTARRFAEQEMTLLQDLHWPTVVSLVDSWDNQGDHLRYLLMPLMEGGNLMQCAKKVASTTDAQSQLEHVAQWYAQMLHGLTYLHWRGVLHRDIKPGNILIAADGRSLRIGDFGSAATLPGDGPHPARWNFVKGSTCTPNYSSPESLREGHFYAASDMWALGATIYEALTLETLFPANLSAVDLEEYIKTFDINEVESTAGNYSANRARQVLWKLQELPSNSKTFVVADMSAVLHTDPLKRPLAATLAMRKECRRCLKQLLQKDALPDKKSWSEHLTMFEEAVKQSTDAQLEQSARQTT